MPSRIIVPGVGAVQGPQRDFPEDDNKDHGPADPDGDADHILVGGASTSLSIAGSIDLVNTGAERYKQYIWPYYFCYISSFACMYMHVLTFDSIIVCILYV